MNKRKVYKSFKRPAHFDYNLIAIGAGAGGLVTSYISSSLGAKTALIEKRKMGGDCLNYGCVPSKALIHAAKVIHQAKKVSRFGTGEFTLDSARVMEYVRSVIRSIEPHDSAERYTSLGVDVIKGEAKLVDPWTVEVNGKRLVTRSIVLATGAEPYIPELPGLEEVDALTSETFWDLLDLPEKILVLGGGPIGCELSQALQRLGCQVTLLEMGPQIMGREDADVANIVRSRFEEEGIRVLTGRKALRFKKDKKGFTLAHVPVGDAEGKEEQIVFDKVLLAIGRRARRGFGMEDLGIGFRGNGTIEANEMLQTNYPNIFAVGDATGPYQFTHFAAHQAWYASLNALLTPFWSFKADYRVIPWATYVDPQVARVGLSENEAKQRGIDYELSSYGFNDLDRAIADDQAYGFIKVLTAPGKDKILGVAIIGQHAAELLAEWTLAMKNGLGLKKIMSTIHAYPTFSESAKYVSAQWMQNHKPIWALRLAEKFFRWRLK